MGWITNILSYIVPYRFSGFQDCLGWSWCYWPTDIFRLYLLEHLIVDLANIASTYIIFLYFEHCSSIKWKF
jgi:hypothetical protein